MRWRPSAGVAIFMTSLQLFFQIPKHPLSEVGLRTLGDAHAGNAFEHYWDLLGSCGLLLCAAGAGSPQFDADKLWSLAWAHFLHITRSSHHQQSVR